jgi:hypothetical protein
VLLDGCDGVRRQAPDVLGAPHDSSHHHEQLVLVRLDRPVSELRHASIAAGVMVSSDWAPNAGRRWASRLER